MIEDEAIALAATPERIIDPIQCNEVIGFLSGHITDLAMADFEMELAATNYEVTLLHTEGKTNSVAKAEFKMSEPYIKWKRNRLELQKLRAYRRVLQSKEKTLQQSSSFVRNNYGNYPTTI